jgi:hypothetical protein
LLGAYSNVTGDGMLRQGIPKGLRYDLEAGGAIDYASQNLTQRPKQMR